MPNTQATSEHLFILARNNEFKSQALEYALRKIGVVPDSEAWRNFLDNMFLLLGITLLSVGVVFFFAYNWDDMGRFAKFGLLEAGILVMAIFATIRGLEHLSAKAAVLAASILFGALLAVYGQTYQTGADAFELFLFWAILILPWVLVTRFAALWLLWLILLNLSLILFWVQVVDSSQHEIPIELFLLLFALNGIALIIWELGRNVEWLQVEWLGTILFLATMTVLIIPTIITIADFDIIWQENILFGLATGLYIFVTIFSLWYYRYQRHNLLLLAICLLGILVAFTTLVGVSLPIDEVLLFLVLAILVIGQATLATKWLLHIKTIWKQEE
ncbi:DUF2157 domain-containing protein [Candidatus Halobeggiatoa sp. HSG11]|nr:DUF2157 domain-containing protein [Candidatus Halobeggiatoa sp. HSG11]